MKLERELERQQEEEERRQQQQQQQQPVSMGKSDDDLLQEALAMMPSGIPVDIEGLGFRV